MYEQKKSKAPWIIAIIAVVIVFFGVCLFMFSCTRIAGIASSGVSATNTIAVIHMEGSIAASGSGYITPETTLSELRDAEEDSSVKAIVLRIDSGGGTAAASEEISYYVRDCSKPVVVSAGDSCASGAYMIASQADYIYCLPATTTGSIGVIMSLANYKELMDKLGIGVENIASGEDKSAGSPYETLTDEDRARFQELVNQINEQFIDLVAIGRDMDRAKVASLATGDIFTGVEAQANGLIDATGTFEDACDKAAELGGADSGYATVDFDEAAGSSLSLLDLLLYFI